MFPRRPCRRKAQKTAGMEGQRYIPAPSGLRGALAESTYTLKGRKASEFDFRGKIVLAFRLFAHQIGAQIFFVVVAEDGHNDRVGPDLPLRFQSRDETAARASADRQPAVGG